jgi:DNA-directed RNA polymerase subunit RPC12/RpoP
VTLTDPAPVITDEDRCARCGEQLEPDQEWCLECGSARTIVHRPPDPRIGAAIAGSIALVVLAAVIIAVIVAGNSSGSSSQTTAATGSSHATTSASKSKSTTASLASWPVGLSGWTVVLGRSADQATATATAEQLGAQGINTGVLDSSQHPHLQAGYYVVFSGRYPNGNAAEAAASALQGKGQSQAIAREVARPGGL